ncbi:zinc finger and SCAN domain-containing protein 21 [Drosophila ficusphila]|uniref:zinc finger and SCAN domain-containing protein 21 n=1 Tax=Drosophila ficusphila TaxID=30025 RepID=UPI0007E622CA|nr:zinc finger and SCAN domain-containing protein 21 [Drosophila ficusphila]
MRISRPVGDSKWGNLPIAEKYHVNRLQKAESTRQNNNKLGGLLFAETEDRNATPTNISTATPTSDSAFFESYSEADSTETHDYEPIPGTKCRTCFRSLSLDGNVKDLYAKDNVDLLYRIKLTTGVRIQSGIKGVPHHICATCQNTLKTAIEFREKCIRIDQNLSQINYKCGFQNDDDEIEAELENVLYEQSAQQTTDVAGMGFLDPDLWSSSENGLEEDEFPPDLESNLSLTEEDFSLDGEPYLPPNDTKEKEKKSRQPKHACNEIVSITKCETKEDIRKVNDGAQIYKVVLAECNRKDNNKPSKPKEKPPKARKPKLSVEEKNRRHREWAREKPLNHICQKCGHSFRHPGQLQMHMLRHDRAKNFECPECPKRFYDAYTRNMHIRVLHKGENPFPCNHCNMSFSSGSSRHKHEVKVHGAGPRILTRQKTKDEHDGRYFCSKCSKSFTTKNSLNYHMNSHNGTKPFKCKVCGRGFTDPNALRRHQGLHDKFPYHCDICSKGFLLRCKLTEHQLVHTAERPHWCEFCDVHYRQKYNLNKHYNSNMHKNNVLKAQEEEYNGLKQTLTDFLNF